MLPDPGTDLVEGGTVSDSELLRLRVRVQRALATLSRPRSEREREEVAAALADVEAALARLAPQG